MRFPLFGPGLNAKSPAVTAKHLLNMYCEMRPQGEKASVVAHGDPGTSLFVDFGDTPCRGAIAHRDFIYFVHRGTFWEVNNAGVKTSRGTLNTTSGRVVMDLNGSQIAIADGTNGYIYTIATTTLAEITDVDFFSNPTSVSFADGYFIWTFADSGRFQISALYDGLSYDALDFANAESAPDDVVRGFVDHGEFIPFGGETTEFWGNSGATDFAYSNLRGTTLSMGLAAENSVCQFNDGIGFLGKSKQGGVQVYMIVGHAARVISTPDLDTIINNYATVADATGVAIQVGGHPWYILNFPSAGKTWMFDALTQMWSELSTNGGRWYGEIVADYINKIRVTDSESGKVYTLEPGLYSHNGESIERELITETVRMPDGERFSADCVRLDVETGVGLVSGQGEDPQIMLSVSRDDGKTWGNELWRSLGPIGSKTRVEWHRLGSNDRFTFKFRVTDPVRVSIISGSLNPTD